MKAALRIAMVGVVLGLVQGAYADSFGSGDYQFEISFVEVGNPGNGADNTGYGAVAYTFGIGQFEVSRDMITKANAEGGLAITLSDMSSYGGNVETHPATGVSWNEAAEIKLSVSIEALVIPSKAGVASAGRLPSAMAF
mgnify:CR=1 FL=1